MVKPNFKYFAKPPEFQKSRSVCQMLPGPPGGATAPALTVRFSGRVICRNPEKITGASA